MPPFVTGIYYDGIGFQRNSMMRIRRAANAAAAAGPGVYPLLDLHTGHDSTPPVCSYIGIFPFVDSFWNGEGFDFSKGPEYWLVEVSLQLHGLVGDRLGGAEGSDDFKGMLFGTTQRNSGTAPALWKLWDDARLNETTMVGFWEDDALVSLSYTCSGAQPPYHSSVRATVYTAYGSHALVSIASFCPSNEPVTLSLDWDGLGLNAAQVTVAAPAVPGVQPNGATFPNATGPFVVNSGEGLFLLIEGAGRR
jgi:hypothetical protein